jgi:hypothetical protein
MNAVTPALEVRNTNCDINASSDSTYQSKDTGPYICCLCATSHEKAIYTTSALLHTFFAKKTHHTCSLLVICLLTNIPRGRCHTVSAAVVTCYALCWARCCVKNYLGSCQVLAADASSKLLLLLLLLLLVTAVVQAAASYTCQTAVEVAVALSLLTAVDTTVRLVANWLWRVLSSCSTYSSSACHPVCLCVRKQHSQHEQSRHMHVCMLSIQWRTYTDHKLLNRLTAVTASALSTSS